MGIKQLHSDNLRKLTNEYGDVSVMKSTISDYENILVWWEMIKYKMKQLTIETSRTLNTNKQTIAKYEKRIDEIKDSNKYLDKQEFLYLQK